MIGQITADTYILALTALLAPIIAVILSLQGQKKMEYQQREFQKVLLKELEEQRQQFTKEMDKQREILEQRKEEQRQEFEQRWNRAALD